MSLIRTNIKSIIVIQLFSILTCSQINATGANNSEIDDDDTSVAKKTESLPTIIINKDNIRVPIKPSPPLGQEAEPAAIPKTEAAAPAAALTPESTSTAATQPPPAEVTPPAVAESTPAEATPPVATETTPAEPTPPVATETTPAEPTPPVTAAEEAAPESTTGSTADNANQEGG